MRDDADEEEEEEERESTNAARTLPHGRRALHESRVESHFPVTVVLG